MLFSNPGGHGKERAGGLNCLEEQLYREPFVIRD